MVGIYKLDEILDAHKEIAQIRRWYKRGYRALALQQLVQLYGYGLGDAYAILDDRQSNP